jgi:hypothetical protein
MIPVPPPPPVSAARLQGQFQLTGLVTAAVAVRGEHKGEHVKRSWTFAPQCATGPCARVALRRTRSGGVDSVLLEETSPAHYAGAGVFYAPLRCAGRRYPRGERVPFTIKLHITEAALVNGVVVATRLRATYRNRKRINLTPCVGVLGHDAARYRGRLVAATTAARSPSVRSPAGS